jgi:hypothetical protein
MLLSLSLGWLAGPPFFNVLLAAAAGALLCILLQWFASIAELFCVQRV